MPEDRLSGAGRRIDLRVVVVPAGAADPRPDPIVYLAGGPGEAAGEHEAWARFDPGAVVANGQGCYDLDTALGNARYFGACRLLPAAGRAADHGPATGSQAPVLLISGSADPQDPPSSTAGAEREWPRSLRLVEPHQFHGVSQWQCPEAVVDALIELGSVEGPAAECITTMESPRFPTS